MKICTLLVVGLMAVGCSRQGLTGPSAARGAASAVSGMALTAGCANDEAPIIFTPESVNGNFQLTWKADPLTELFEVRWAPESNGAFDNIEVTHRVNATTDSYSAISDGRYRASVRGKSCHGWSAVAHVVFEPSRTEPEPEPAPEPEPDDDANQVP